MTIITACLGMITGVAIFSWGLKEGMKRQEKKLKDMEAYIKNLETKCFDHAFDW